MLASMTPMWLASVLVSRINLQQRNGDQPEAMDVKKWHRIWQKPEIWGKNQSSSKNLSSSPGQLHSSITCLLIFTFTCYNICIKIVKSTINNKGPRVRVYSCQVNIYTKRLFSSCQVIDLRQMFTVFQSGNYLSQISLFYLSGNNLFQSDSTFFTSGYFQTKTIVNNCTKLNRSWLK